MFKLLKLPLLAFILILASHKHAISLKDPTGVVPSSIPELKLTYIGNMGVLLENKDQTVLIDGLHKKYKSAYAYPSSSVVASLLNGNYPGFTDIELNLITHAHNDHYNPELSIAFLKENKSALTMGPPQAKEAVRAADPNTKSLLERFRVVPSDNEVQNLKHQGISVTAISCGHTYQQKHSKVENIAYVVNLNGYKVLHVGDAEWALLAPALEKMKASTLNLDIAILPSWMLLEKSASKKVNELINPHTLIASHMDPNFIDQTTERIRENFPEVVCLTTLNKTITFNK